MWRCTAHAAASSIQYSTANRAAQAGAAAPFRSTSNRHKVFSASNHPILSLFFDVKATVRPWTPRARGATALRPWPTGPQCAQASRCIGQADARDVPQVHSLAEAAPPVVLAVCRAQGPGVPVLHP